MVAGHPWFHPLGLIRAHRSVFGVNIHSMYDQVEKFTRWMSTIRKGYEEGWMRPHIDRTFSFDEAGDAHACIEARKNTGKVVLVP